MGTELAWVADDEAVAFDGERVIRYEGLDPGRQYAYDGLEFRTLPRPAGELLCRVVTANDVHHGETECGVLDGFEGGPVFRAEEGESPYPEVMAAAVIEEMGALQPDAVVVKGDLTANGREDEYRSFLDRWSPAFGDRLHHVRGNHDAYHGGLFAAWPTQLVDLPGTRLAILDTTIPGRSSGTVSELQVEWLDEVGHRAHEEGTAVLVFGHHHVWDPSSTHRSRDYFGIDPDASEALVDVVARRHRLLGYFAGHTHRNRVRRFAATAAFPWVEVACTKDFPGAWAEYRVYEGGALQIGRRATSPAALAWANKTSAMFGGLYPQYAYGDLADRCFAFGPRPV